MAGALAGSSEHSFIPPRAATLLTDARSAPALLRITRRTGRRGLGSARVQRHRAHRPRRVRARDGPRRTALRARPPSADIPVHQRLNFLPPSPPGRQQGLWVTASAAPQAGPATARLAMAELRCGRSLTIPNFHMGWTAEASRRWFARQRHALVFSREAANPRVAGRGMEPCPRKVGRRRDPACECL